MNALPPTRSAHNQTYTKQPYSTYASNSAYHRHVSASKFCVEDTFGDENFLSVLGQSAQFTPQDADSHKTQKHLLPSRDMPTLSLEVFPARSAQRLRANVSSVRKMLKLGADFVTVTYGAAGSRQEGTKEIVSWLTEAHVPTYAHLTCHANSLRDLDATIDELLEIGVAGILALRGDKQADGKPLVLNHATDLLGRIRERADKAGLPVRLAVAAFANGHPESLCFEDDSRILARKQDAGADFAITQHFFSVDDYVRLVDCAREHGAQLPIVPGLTPITSHRRLVRMCELAQIDVPADVSQDLLKAGADKAARTEIGVERTVRLASQLADVGAPGIQLFTMNDALIAERIVSEIAPFFGKT